MPRMPRVQSILLLLILVTSCRVLQAQEHSPAPAAPAATAQASASSKGVVQPHKFWDRENILLFTGVGAARMLDYASTRYLRDEGNNELLLTNSIVDNRPLFVGIELAGTAASIGVSYLFHRTGHHSLERWVSIVHIGVGAGGAVRNYLLEPPVPAVQP